MVRIWSDDKTFQLIREQYPCIFNASDINYVNLDISRESYNSTAKKLGNEITDTCTDVGLLFCSYFRADDVLFDNVHDCEIKNKEYR